MTNFSVQRKCKAYKIYTQLGERLNNNVYPKHSPMPAVSVLAKEFGASVGTIDHALQMLAAEGKVVRKIGSGTYPARFVQHPRVACLLTDMPVENPIDNWSSSWLNTQMVIKILQKSDCEFKVFSYCDLLQAYFSPRFLKNFDILIAEQSFCDKNSKKMIYNFKGNVFMIGGIFPVSASVCQVIPDFIPAMTSMLKNARNAGIKKMKFYYHRQGFKEVYDTALLAADWENAVCEFIPLNRCNMIDAYRLGQSAEANREVFHICSSDVTAAGMYQAFTDRGLHSGEFAICGCGNNEDFGFMPFNGKRLTTLCTDTTEDISNMIQLMFECLKKGSKISNITKTTSSVIYRDSTFF